MRVLQINGSDNKGGAAKVALGLHRALNSRGHNATLLVKNRSGDNPGVEEITPRLLASRNWFARRKTAKACTYATATDGGFPKTLGEKYLSDFDIIHLHDAPYFNFSYLPWLTKIKPVVWTLHTMAPFTGNCLYDYGCGKYQTECGDCPQHGLFPLNWLPVDGSRANMQIKREAFAHSGRLYPVGVSEWISSRAREGAMGKFKITTAPNGIDTSAFTPIDKGDARRQLGIPPDAQVILFSVSSNPEDTRKGTDIIFEALQLLNLPETWLIPLGIAGDPSMLKTLLAGLPNPYLAPRHLDTDEALRLHYSAADIVWHPSRADTSSLVSMEACASGTPVIAAAVGGVPEVVEDDVCGLLIDPENPSSLAHATEGLFKEPDRLAALSRTARTHAEKHFDASLMADRYLKLYQSL